MTENKIFKLGTKTFQKIDKVLSEAGVELGMGDASEIIEIIIAALKKVRDGRK